jgi:hypothetical protein
MKFKSDSIYSHLKEDLYKLTVDSLKKEEIIEKLLSDVKIPKTGKKSISNNTKNFISL